MNRVRSRSKGSRPSRLQLQVEPLEDRLSPATRLFALTAANIQELNPGTGATIATLALPAGVTAGQGIAFNGTNLFMLGTEAGTLKLFELNATTGAVIDSDAITPTGTYDGVAAVGNKIYLQDAGADQIREFNPATDQIVNSLSPGFNLDGGLAGAGAPFALYTRNGTGNITQLNPMTGAVVSSFNPSLPGGFGNITGLAVVDNMIVASSQLLNQARVYSRSGIFLYTIATPAAGASLGSDIGMTNASLIDNGGFEAGSTAGWTVSNQAPGNGFQASATPPGGSTLPGPTGGFAAYAGLTGIETASIMIQDIALPSIEHSYNLTLNAFYELTAGPFVTPASLDNTFTPNVQFRIDIMKTTASIFSVQGADIHHVIFATTPASALTGTLSLSQALSPTLAGQTVRLRIAVVNTEADTIPPGTPKNLYVGVDNVRLEATYTGLAPAANNNSYTVNEDTPVNDTVVGNDTFPSQYRVSLSPPGTLPGSVPGTLTLNVNGTFSYQPPANTFGVFQFFYDLVTPTATSTATVTITVLSANDAPTAVADSYSVVEDGVLNVPVGTGVLANDSDTDGPPPMTATLFTGAGHGVVTLNPNGSFTYTPSPNYSGPDSFTYRVKDGADAASVGSVSINVTVQNDPPVANDDFLVVNEDSIDNVLDVLDNDTQGPDGPGILQVVSVTPAGNGTVTLIGGVVRYTPNPGFAGVDFFTYTMNDGTPGSQDSAMVMLAVTAINDAPTVQVPGTTPTFSANTALIVSGIAVNDSDANQGDGQMQVTIACEFGRLTLSTIAGLDFGFPGAVGDGTADKTMTFRGALASVNLALSNLVYMPNANFGGDDNISIQVDDRGNFGDGGILSDSDSFLVKYAAGVIRVQPSITNPGKTDLLVSASNSNDTITIKMTGTSKTKMSVIVNDILIGKAYKPTGNILVYGLDGNDSIAIQPKIKKQAFLDGGLGNDTITGGKANDILLGRDGNDSITDAGGRNLFIAGDGIDSILAGGGDDILIGGGSIHEGDGAALEAIMKEWTLLTPYADRVAHLKNGTGLNGSVVLTTGTVFNDGDTDSLTGNIGLDYFWLFGSDTSDINAGTGELSN